MPAPDGAATVSPGRSERRARPTGYRAASAAPARGEDLKGGCHRHAQPGAGLPCATFQKLGRIEMFPAKSVDVGPVRLERCHPAVKGRGRLDGVRRLRGSEYPHLLNAV